jgi:hypothetical protein
MIPRPAIVLCVISALVSFGAQTAGAGTTGMLSGRVYACDPMTYCAPPLPSVPFAKVSIESLGIGVLDTTADKNGYFTFVSLTPDRYLVFAKGVGLGVGCIAFARVSADQTTSVFTTVYDFTKVKCLCHCYRHFKPSGDLPTWSIGPNGNFEF